MWYCIRSRLSVCLVRALDCRKLWPRNSHYWYAITYLGQVRISRSFGYSQGHRSKQSHKCNQTHNSRWSAFDCEETLFNEFTRSITNTQNNLTLILRQSWQSECVGFNVPLDTYQVISETSLSRQSIALVLTTKNKETEHHIHPKHKRETNKTLLGTEQSAHNCFTASNSKRLQVVC